MDTKKVDHVVLLRRQADFDPEDQAKQKAWEEARKDLTHDEGVAYVKLLESIVPESERYPDVPDWQKAIVKEYGELFVNTGGNDPLDLLQDYNRPSTPNRPNTLAKANIVRFSLAVSVSGQVCVIQKLKEAGKL